MPTAPTKGKSRKFRLTEKASSFHGKLPVEMCEARIRRPKTDPDLLGSAGRNLGVGFNEVRPLPQKLTKLLLNVTIPGSVGAVQVVVSPDSSVEELIAAALKQYAKEGRRPVIQSDATKFDLHYSQFSLESLDRDEKLMALGSRNFFLCPQRTKPAGAESSSGGAVTTSSCSKEAEKPNKGGFAWLKFMDFML